MIRIVCCAAQSRKLVTLTTSCSGLTGVQEYTGDSLEQKTAAVNVDLEALTSTVEKSLVLPETPDSSEVSPDPDSSPDPGSSPDPDSSPDPASSPDSQNPPDLTPPEMSRPASDLCRGLQATEKCSRVVPTAKSTLLAAGGLSNCKVSLAYPAPHTGCILCAQCRLPVSCGMLWCLCFLLLA